MKKTRHVIGYIFLTVLFTTQGFDIIYAQQILSTDVAKFNAKEEIIKTSVNNYQSIQKNQLSERPYQNAPALKSRGRAFLQSLLLPGWGQYYAKSKKSMRFFIFTEALSIASYIGFTTWGNWLEDDYRALAVTHAGVDLKGKSDTYFVDIGNFNNIDEFNQAQLQNRELIDVYEDRVAFFWQWDSEQNREKFEDIRIRRDRAVNNSEFALAGIFLNHLVSAIHSTLSVYNYNKNLTAQQETGFNFNFGYDHRNQQLAFNVSKTL